MSEEKLCEGCGESIDDPGMDMCSHCAEEAEGESPDEN
jgi:predicted amidophosphoribosyltransferase